MIVSQQNEYGDFPYQTKKYLIEKFLKPEKIKGNIKKEAFLAKRLLIKYPKAEFWRHYELGFRLNSLAFFFTPDGASRLSDAFSEFSLDFSPQTQYYIDKEADFLGDVEIIKSKPRSVKEFLKT